MTKLGVNIDHIATVRNARGGHDPDPVTAAALAVLGGADQITVHLREDRRHIVDRDVHLLKEVLSVDLNLEMAATDEMVQLAIKTCPDQVTLVPEKREEKTTEGGLDLKTHYDTIKKAIISLNEANIPVILFIEPDNNIVCLSHDLKASGVEFHTGAYANASTRDQQNHQLKLISAACNLAEHLDLLIHAGHGLNYTNVEPIAHIEAIRELNIGHAIISRSLFVGLEQAVRDMKILMLKGRV